MGCDGIEWVGWLGSLRAHSVLIKNRGNQSDTPKKPKKVTVFGPQKMALRVAKSKF